MSYEVVWWQRALDQMAGHLAAHSGRRSELAVAMREVAEALADDPDAVGESRVGDYRVLVVRPLTVYFRPVAAE